MRIGRAVATRSTPLLVPLLVLVSTGVPRPAVAQQVSLSGAFHTVWGDPPAGVPQIRYTLVDDQGRVTELLVDEALLRPLGGRAAVNRKRVTIVGDRVGPDARVVRVRSVRFARAEDAAAAQLGMSFVTGPQPWVTILCRFGDSPTVTPHPKSWFETLMLGTTAPNMDHYWRELSYDNINVTGSVVAGWHDLPQPRSYYVYDSNGDGTDNLDHGRAAQDCTAVADPNVFFPDFVGINLMFNEDLDCCAWGGGWTLNRDGVTRSYRMTWMPTWGWGNQGVIGHEMGHGFGLPHSSGPYSATYDSRWDVMSNIWGNCPPEDPEYGCIGVHTISYHKDLLQWIPPERKYTPAIGTSATITIDRLGQSPAGATYLMAQIPIMGTSTEFYTVEARRFAGYDVTLPGGAIILHRVNIVAGRPARVVDIDGNGDPNDAGAMWTPGEAFTDLSNETAISVDSATATGFNVTVIYGLVLTVSPTSRLDSVILGSTTPVNDSTAVTLTGTTDWTATHGGGSWLTVTNSTGTGSGVVRWSRDPTGLGIGTYVDTIVVTASAVGSPAFIIDSLKVQSVLILAVSPASRLDSAVEGSTAPIMDSASVTITGLGSDTTSWSATVGGGVWLALTTASGTGGGLLRWTRDPTALSPGTYVDTITVSVPGAGGSPALIVDTLRILEPLALALAPKGRSSTASTGRVAPLPDSTVVTLTGATSGTASWTATHGAGSWLTFLVPSGSGSGVVRWIRNPSGLRSGTYIDTITVTVADSISDVVIDTVRLIPPPVEVMRAAEELLSMQRLSDLEKRYLDIEGNADGAYNLGDFLAFLDRNGSSTDAQAARRLLARSAPGRGRSRR